MADPCFPSPDSCPMTPDSWCPMAARKAFLLRVDPKVLEAIQRWADDELRSLNGQIEYLLRQALVKAGRQKMKTEVAEPTDSHST